MPKHDDIAASFRRNPVRRRKVVRDGLRTRDEARREVEIKELAPERRFVVEDGVSMLKRDRLVFDPD